MSNLATKTEGQVKQSHKKPVTMNLRTIHRIGKKHGLNHDDLHDRAVLGFPVDSMSDLTENQLWQLAQGIESDYARWWTATGEKGKSSQKQLDYLQDLWVQKSREKTKQSLLNWLANKRKESNNAFPADSPAWYTRQEMYKVVGFLLNERW
ncbi:MAG: hypothetical protein ABJI69_09095 [Balneola sp.]